MTVSVTSGANLWWAERTLITLGLLSELGEVDGVFVTHCDGKVRSKCLAMCKSVGALERVMYAVRGRVLQRKMRRKHTCAVDAVRARGRGRKMAEQSLVRL